jgi:hypothetical protein
LPVKYCFHKGAATKAAKRKKQIPRHVLGMTAKTETSTKSPPAPQFFCCGVRLRAGRGRPGLHGVEPSRLTGGTAAPERKATNCRSLGPPTRTRKTSALGTPDVGPRDDSENKRERKAPLRDSLRSAARLSGQAGPLTGASKAARALDSSRASQGKQGPQLFCCGVRFRAGRGRPGLQEDQPSTLTAGLGVRSAAV